MSKLFSYGDVKNHPSRSGFDLAKKNAFTAKVGELLPVYWRLCYPGDKFTLSHQHFTRTQPVNTAAFTRIREYFDWYFVPLRLLNKNMTQALVQMQENPVQAEALMQSRIVTTDIPYIPFYNRESSSGPITEPLDSISGILRHAYSLLSPSPRVGSNQFNFALSATSAKLLSYLGYKRFLAEDNDSPAPIEGYEVKSLGLSSDPKFNLSAAVPFSVNVLPLLAYQKIYADFFRFSQWEKNEPFTYNADYYAGGNFLAPITSDSLADDFWSSNNFLTLRYCNWQKDMFMGGMPEQQFGDVASVNIGMSGDGGFIPLSAPTASSSSGFSVGVGSSGFDLAADKSSGVSSVTLSSSASTGFDGLPLRVSVNDIVSSGHLGVDMSSSLSGSFSVLQLRLAEATQKWKEISQCSDQTYRDQIQAHFGVSLSPALSDKCIYIGGSASSIDINEVVNNALYASGDEKPVANIKGKGVGTSQGSENFSADEYGILMCIYHAVPLLDYDLSGVKQELLYISTEDLPVPEFDSIGMQTLPLQVLYNAFGNIGSWMPTMPGNFLSYVPRFVELKTDVDEINGAFSTTLKNWVAAYTPEFFQDWGNTVTGGNPSAVDSALNFNFFKVNPHIVDSIFNVVADSSWDSDCLLVNAFFDVKAVRNFDYNGMPY